MTQETNNIVFSMKEVTKLLLLNKGITEGYYVTHIAPSFKGAIINSSENDDNPQFRQSVIIAFESIELVEVNADIPNAVDASTIRD